MDVAQALQAHEEQTKKLTHEELAKAPPPTEVIVVPSPAVGSDAHAPAPMPDVKSMAANWGQQANAEVVTPEAPPPLERRKSWYQAEKYSAFTLPPLFEEKTPVQSPAGTLSREAGKAITEVKVSAPEVVDEKVDLVVPQPAIISQESVKAPPPPVEDKFVHLSKLTYSYAQNDILRHYVQSTTMAHYQRLTSQHC